MRAGMGRLTGNLKKKDVEKVEEFSNVLKQYTAKFEKWFVRQAHGPACDVCNCLWFPNDLEAAEKTPS